MYGVRSRKHITPHDEEADRTDNGKAFCSSFLLLFAVVLIIQLLFGVPITHNTSHYRHRHDGRSEGLLLQRQYSWYS
jgi:hypothetical protein